MPLRSIGLAPSRQEIAACLDEERCEPRLLEHLRRHVDGVALRDAPEADLRLLLGEHHRLLVGVELDVPVADEGETRLHVLVRRRMWIEILVELPEPVEGVERDVEGALRDLARVHRFPDDVEGLGADLHRRLAGGRVDPRDLAVTPGRHQRFDALDLLERGVEGRARLPRVGLRRRVRGERDVRSHRGALPVNALGDKCVCLCLLVG